MRRALLAATFALCYGQAQSGLKTRPLTPPPVVMPGPGGSQDPRLAGAGTKIAATAERFSQNAQQYMCLETLRQRAIRTRSVRKKKNNTVALGSAPQYDQRQITSYYSFTTVGKSPVIREIRQVLKVDKETVNKEFEGRRSFRAALLSRDDDAKKNMLTSFIGEGLKGVATDLGQMVLLFDRNSIGNFTFEYDRDETTNGVPTIVIRYTQRRGSEHVHIDERGQEMKSDLRGWLWLRFSDYLPVRITMISARTEKKHDIREEAEVDYAENSSGALLPSSAIHRRWDDDILAAEDDFRYSEWQPLK